MPHVVCFGSPVALMASDEEMKMRAEVIAAMAAVEGAGFEERQVSLAIPAETPIADANRPNYYKPWIHVKFAWIRGRNEETLEAVCEAAACVLAKWFMMIFDVKEVQYTWEVDMADRFGRFPKRRA